MNARIDKLRLFMTEHALDGMLVMKPENRRYFSGFTGSAGALLVSAQEARLITDFRYVVQAEQEASGCEIIRHTGTLLDEVHQSANSLKLKTVGFEADYVTYDLYQTIQSKLPTLQLAGHKLDGLRMVKDNSELTALTQAVKIADQAFTSILPYIKPGRTENEIAMELEYTMKRLGATKAAFDIIVASGIRSALPHGRPTDKIIQSGDFVTMDFGAVYNGYHSDITRTVVIGKASEKQRTIYDLVLRAQLAGITAVKPAKSGSEVDKVARQIIAEAGYGNYFGHGLGHGIGLVIHEDPRLSPTAPSDLKLQPGMTITVEPGVYLPDWGGVRIEDSVVVTAAGCDVLTSSSKQLIEIEY